jgi:hypothetical protein
MMDVDGSAMDPESSSHRLQLLPGSSLGLSSLGGLPGPPAPGLSALQLAGLQEGMGALPALPLSDASLLGGGHGGGAGGFRMEFIPERTEIRYTQRAAGEAEERGRREQRREDEGRRRGEEQEGGSKEQDKEDEEATRDGGEDKDDSQRTEEMEETEGGCFTATLFVREWVASNINGNPDELVVEHGGVRISLREVRERGDAACQGMGWSLCECVGGWERGGGGGAESDQRGAVRSVPFVLSMPPTPCALCTCPSPLLCPRDLLAPDSPPSSPPPLFSSSLTLLFRRRWLLAATTLGPKPL